MIGWPSLVQLFIVVAGCLGMWLLTRADSARKRRNAYLVLLVGQPFWIGITLQAHQWGMLAMALFYSGLFVRALVAAQREVQS